MKRSMREAEDFDAVYDELFPLIFRVAYRVTGETTAAEDLCQEAFVRYLQRSQRFPTRDQAKYWLIRVVRNLSLNHEKRRGRERRAVERLSHEPRPSNPSGERVTIRAESSKLVQEALNKVAFQQRIALILREYAGMTYKEIARSLRISESNVKVRVFRAREQLKKILDEEDLDVS